MLYEHPAVAEAAVVGIPHAEPRRGGRRRRRPQAGCRGRPGGAAGVRPGAGRGLQVPAAGVAVERRCPRRPPARCCAARWSPRGRWHRASGQPADAAAPLDMLLAAAALGPARRLLPGGAGARFAAGLARRPDRLARGRLPRRRARPGRCRPLEPWPRRPATAASATPPGRPTRCCAASSRPTSPRRDRRGAGGRRRPGVARRRADAAARREPGAGARAQQHSLPPARPSGRALVDTGRRQRGPRRPAPGHRPGHAATGAVDGDARRVRGRRRPGA